MYPSQPQEMVETAKKPLGIISRQEAHRWMLNSVLRNLVENTGTEMDANQFTSLLPPRSTQVQVRVDWTAQVICLQKEYANTV